MNIDNLKGIQQELKEKTIYINGNITEQVTISLKPSFKIRRAPKAKLRRY